MQSVLPVDLRIKIEPPPWMVTKSVLVSHLTYSEHVKIHLEQSFLQPLQQVHEYRSVIQRPEREKYPFFLQLAQLVSGPSFQQENENLPTLPKWKILISVEDLVWGHSKKGMSLSPSVVIEIGLFWKTSQQFSMWFVHSVIPMWNFWPSTVFFLKNTLFITLLKEIVQQFWICNIFLVSQQMKHFHLWVKMDVLWKMFHLLRQEEMLHIQYWWTIPLFHPCSLFLILPDLEKVNYVINIRIKNCHHFNLAEY